MQIPARNKYFREDKRRHSVWPKSLGLFYILPYFLDLQYNKNARNCIWLLRANAWHFNYTMLKIKGGHLDMEI